MNRQNERQATLTVEGKDYQYYPVHAIRGVEKLPFSLLVLLENVLRNASDNESATSLAQRIVEAGCAGQAGSEIEFMPARVLFQDFTGVPVFVDFATMREACKNLGGDPSTINPQIPCDLVIDHSVIADEAGCASALQDNMNLEFQRNRERYAFLKWAQSSFDQVRIVAPGAGICHQLNIEKFAPVVMVREQGESTVAYFDTLVGTDSHTPTANGIGVLGWGVGGIEAEAAALGQPITTLVPRVVGVKLTGSLRDGVSGMDVSLTFAERLRSLGVVGCFVECFGEGVSALSATQRACVSNMTPEYGCTCTLFPIDEQTLSYLEVTGRSEQERALIEAYAKEQGLWNDPQAQRTYSEVIEINLSDIEPSLAGPSRPHDRIALSQAQVNFHSVAQQRNLSLDKTVDIEIDGDSYQLTHGALAIAAVTSCTTATDPAMMLAAGLLAQKAAQAGLSPKPWIKCILAPGSQATELLLERAGLISGLQALGFYNCGFGCMSCIGNSGPIKDALHDVADQIELASILSGNRNFEGRISPDVSQNYLAAPALVIAYALAGTMDFDFETQAFVAANGNEVFLRDIMPTQEEIQKLLDSCLDKSLYEEGSKTMFEGTEEWRSLSQTQSDTFDWDEASTYVRRAPYFDGMELQPEAPAPITDACVLALLGDFITTDHISPAGSIAADSPTARYLSEHGVDSADFNTYGSRRGNHEVMMRGTFANVKLENALGAGRKGGWTTIMPDGEPTSIFDAAEHYRSKGIAQVVLAGKMYGSGSSRDWAAKGPKLLGVDAVFAESFERIHRSNLIGMGILPLQFKEGESVESLGLDGSETFSLAAFDLGAGLPQPREIEVCAAHPSGKVTTFTVVVRIDTPTEGRYLAHGGILPYVLRQLIRNS